MTGIPRRSILRTLLAAPAVALGWARGSPRSEPVSYPLGDHDCGYRDATASLIARVRARPGRHFGNPVALVATSSSGPPPACGWDEIVVDMDLGTASLLEPGDLLHIEVEELEADGYQGPWEITQIDYTAGRPGAVQAPQPSTPLASARRPPA